jgi:hypothetical protein
MGKKKAVSLATRKKISVGVRRANAKRRAKPYP